MLTGNKDVDYEILYKLSDYDLGNVCKVNQYSRDLCRNDNFWMNRTSKRFSPIFGTFEKLKEFKEQKNQTWRDYYIDLVNSMEIYYQNRYENKIRERGDYNMIVKYIINNTQKYIDCYKSNLKCSLDWLNAYHQFAE